MTTATPQTKSSTATAVVPTKSSVVVGRYAKSGTGWFYDQAGITYDGPLDPVSGLPILYDSLGNAVVWTPLPKS